MVKKIFTSIAIAFIASVTSAQQKIEMPLWPSAEYDSISGMVPSLTVYLPARSNGVGVVMCPGGGYGHWALSHEGHDMASWFNDQGVTYGVLHYRLPGGRDTIPMADAGKAIQILRDHATEWGLDPGKIGIMGASAGGHLAASLATLAEADTKPSFQILLYPVISMDPHITHKGSRTNLIGEKPTGDMELRYSLSRQVRDDTPPAFIALSADDRTVEPANSIEYFTELTRHKVPVTMLVYPAGGHGWGFRDSFRYKPLWTSALEMWLKEMSGK